MTFAVRPNFSVGNIPNPIDITQIADLEITPTNASGAITFNSDGSFSVVGNGTVAGAGWHQPTLTGIGTTYWVRMQVTSGASPTSGDAVNSWLQLNTGRNWTWTQTVVGSLLATVRFDIATDSGGANIIATKTGVNVNVEEDT